MARMNRKYDKAFKLEAIRLYETSGKSVSQIETELGITSGLLNKWRVRHRNEGPAGFVGSGQQTEIEVRRLKRKNEILRQERDILKKAIPVFAKDGH
ncbi:MAG: transposase [Anaerolineaceae bacterium]|nr:transposase [Anaerolineaceae bacterium]